MRPLVRLCCALAALTLGASLYTNNVVSPVAGAAPAAATPTPTPGPTPVPTGINVNSLLDAAADDGLCTLREAITSANTNTASGAAPGECAAGGALDAINFSVTGTILLTSALPDLTTALALNGPGARLLTVSGNNATRVFAVASTATVYISDLTVSGGRATFGGGINNGGGTLTINNCAITGNSVTTTGGGINNNNAGRLNVGNSTISHNSTDPSGGGGGLYNSAHAVLTNTTVSTNSAGGGGGLVNVGTLTLRYTTVAGNSATNSGGGISNPGIGSLHFGNTIIAGNSAPSGPDGAGATFVSEDYNLIGDTSGFSIGGTTTHNITGVSADLGPLADNGGATQTHRPHYTSPAVDKGRSVGGGFGVLNDQRGMARPLNFTEVADAAGGDGSDIGAVELQADDQPESGHQPFVVNSKADTDDGSCDAAGAGTGNRDCTLREALNAANALAGADTINFDPAVFAAPGPHTIELTSTLPAIGTSVTVNGPGAGVLTLRRSASGFYRLLYINATPVRLSGMTLTNGRAPDGPDAAGGALVNRGVTTLTGVRITGNRSGDGTAGSPSGGIGGGIYNYGTLTLVNCLVGGNTTGNGVTDGGGGGGIYSSGTLTLKNCLVNGNGTGTGPNAGGSGGGVYASGEAALTNTTVSNNTTGAGGFAPSRGGGVYANGLTLTLTNSTITGNTARFAENHGVDVGPSQASISVGNTIVARNGAGAQSDLTGLPNWYTSRGHNIIGVASNSGGGNAFIDGQKGDRVGTPASPFNPLLAALGDYGGPTQTFALLPGSPAIDAGSGAGAPAHDQRGVGRVGAVDIGAFESRGFQLAATAGTPQSAIVLTAFGTPMSVTVTSAFGEPTAGGLVTFSAPASGASGTFAGPATVGINASGVATAPAFTANGTAGSYNVTASANSYSATLALTNLKRDQVITFDALADKTYGDADFTISATASSGLPVSFSTLGGACTVSGSTVHITGAGTCVITATQLGNNIYNGAPAVARSFRVAQASTSVAVSSNLNPSSVGQSVSFTATVTSPAGPPPGGIFGVVNFFDGGVAIPNCASLLSPSGQATCTTSALSAGVHAITAEYATTSPNFTGSTGTLQGGQTVGGIFGYSQPLYTVAERGGSVTITVHRAGITSQAMKVDYATDDGSTPSVAVPCAATTGLALERCDYTRAAGTLSFAPGEAQKTFTVLVNDDSYADGPETLALRLSNPLGGAGLGAQSASVLQIADDATESAGNPVDDDSFFVRQHYLDFLSREPDAAGLAFWKDQMANCGSPDPLVCRVNVSAAFFLSIEFQQTGYLVERMYKVAYGDATGTSGLGGPHQLGVPVVRLNEFLPDTQRIGQNVVVGVGDWQQQLELNKQTFALEFVRRERFTVAFPSTMTAGEFVTKLDQNAGGVLTAAERSDLAAALGAAPFDPSVRAQVVRAVAENAALSSAEFNRAFVLMQYFGYLRRDPNAAPDADYTGFEFWLTKLDQFGGNFVNAEMVKAFIQSDEYRKRFGQ